MRSIQGRRSSVQFAPAGDSPSSWVDELRREVLAERVDFGLFADSPPACNTGVGGQKVDSDAIKVGKNTSVSLLGRAAFDELAAIGASDAVYSIEDGGPSLFGAGTDYLRLTSKLSESGENLAERVESLIVKYADMGNYRNDSAYVLGYRGISCGPVFVGLRPDSVMAQASSVASDELLMVSQGLGVHPTRVDLQVTVLYGEDTPGVGRRAADEHQAWRELQVSSGRMVPRPPRLIDGYGAGDSCLVGARASEAFGRCYDKHRESLEKYRSVVNSYREKAGAYPVGAWRFEVEYKGSQAEQVYDRLVGCSNYGSESSALVCGWYGARGVSVPVPAEYAAPVRTVKNKTDVERSLMWLRDSVHPTIRKLVDLGYKDEVLRALGVSPLWR